MLLVAYDGSPFHGFAAQRTAHVDTVGGRLEKALAAIAGREISIVCAGRTDKGVHALGQVVHADLPADVVEQLLSAEPDGRLRGLERSLTRQCGPAIVVRRAFPAPDGFDARRSAVARRYRYEILATETPDPLWRLRTWHVPHALDLAALRIGADALLGEHDFRAFCRLPPGQDGELRRRVTDVSWERLQYPERLAFEIEANAFCHQMVRSIVGHLVATGEGRLAAGELRAILAEGARSNRAQPAPPEGLVLLLVRYPDDLVPDGVLTAREGIGVGVRSEVTWRLGVSKPILGSGSDDPGHRGCSQGR